MEILERNDGYKGFNQTGISEIIAETGWPGEAIAGHDGAKAAWLIAEGDTFTEVYAVPELVVLAVLGLALIAVFHFGSRFERRGTGTVTAQQAVEGAR